MDSDASIYTHDDQGGPHAWRARNNYGFEQPHNGCYGEWDIPYDRAGDRLREGSGHVLHCQILQGFSSRIPSWNTLQRRWFSLFQLSVQLQHAEVRLQTRKHLEVIGVTLQPSNNEVNTIHSCISGVRKLRQLLAEGIRRKFGDVATTDHKVLNEGATAGSSCYCHTRFGFSMASETIM